ncbi:MAG: hypothetical protein COB40_14055 [Marinosulfonomonas sp.]|nr:MAG: hypothetical protein COB40_14055 [Marinosulfonomonas sp.]
MPTISLFSLVLAVAPTARMVAQLLLIGFALVYIFETENALIGLAVVAVMIGVSAWISIRVIAEDRRRAFGRSVISLGLAGGVVLVFVLFVVLRISEPWYQPRLIIPIAGMIFSSAMTAITLAAERFGRERAAGASYVEARKAAWTAALIPQINALLAVGLVSLPGMMTGQILSGVDPLIAVRYQIVVMAMILQSSGLSVAIFLTLSKTENI